MSKVSLEPLPPLNLPPATHEESTVVPPLPVAHHEESSAEEEEEDTVREEENGLDAAERQQRNGVPVGAQTHRDNRPEEDTEADGEVADAGEASEKDGSSEEDGIGSNLPGAKELGVFTVAAVLSFHALYWLCGISAIICGCWLIYQSADIGDGLLNAPLPIAVIVFGAMIVILSFMGVGVLISRSKAGLLVHVVLLGLLFCAFVGTMGSAGIYKGQLEERLRVGWVEASDSTRDTIQTRYDCCGFVNGSDLPGPNCQYYGGTSAADAGVADQLTGCSETLVEEASLKLDVFIGACLAGIAVTVMDMVMSLIVWALQ